MEINVFCMSATALSWDGVLCPGCREALEAVSAIRKRHTGKNEQGSLDLSEEVEESDPDLLIGFDGLDNSHDLPSSVEDGDRWETLTHDQDSSECRVNASASKDPKYLQEYEDYELLDDSDDSGEDADETKTFTHDYASLKQCALLSCRLCLMVLGLSGTHIHSTSHVRLLNCKIVAADYFIPGDQWDEDFYTIIKFTYRCCSAVVGCKPSTELEFEDLRGRKLTQKIDRNGIYSTERAISGVNIGSKHCVAARPTLNTSTSSHETLEKLLEWTRICAGTHKACQRWRKLGKRAESLPTRLLAISSGSCHVSIKLVLGTMLPDEIQYTTLSHCWGGYLPLQLTIVNFEEFRSNISWEQLPQTFKDAAVVTNSLGVKYLWIDALCIIQDDTTDWLHEASRMASVYANSYLNISADASLNPDGGLFRNRDPATVEAFLVPALGKDSDSSYCCYRNNWQKAVEAAPLNHRAWVLQERYLAPRVVHFGADQIYWECCSHETCEGLPNYLKIKEKIKSSKAFFARRRSESIKHLFWTNIIQNYSRGRLTNNSDRPVAIAGLARAFCDNMERR